MSQKRAHLYVEGRDDMFAVLGLLERHGVDCKDESRLFDVHTSKGLKQSDTESVEALLGGMDFAIRQSRGRPTGFVFDADQDVDSRWRAISDRLRQMGFDCPLQPVSGGVVCNAKIQGADFKVGVWLMPNNSDKGMLEDFLHELIEEGDKLLPIARSSTATAFATDPRFSAVHEPKAVIHNWLAWQENPGLPFGTAITAHYFRHDTEIAKAFVNWFRELFGV